MAESPRIIQPKLFNNVLITPALFDASGGEVLYWATPKGLEYHAHDASNLLLTGPRGTGKSIIARNDFHMRAQHFPGFKYVITRRTFPELNKTHILSMDAEMRKLGGRFNKTERIAHYANGSFGFFAHCETEQDVLNLLGAEFGAILFDEATTFPFEWIQKLATSCRVPEGAGYNALVRLTTNPLGPSVNEIWRYYVDKDVDPEEDGEYDPNDYAHLHSTLDDNPWIDREKYKKRFAGLPEHVRRAWLDGERMVEDCLFDFHRSKNGKPHHELPELPRMSNGETIFQQPWIRFYRAFDSGFYPDPAYCVWIAVIGRRVIAFKEKVWLRKTGEDIAREIIEDTNALGIKVTETFCDPSIDLNSPADIYTMRDKMERVGLPMTPSVNSRELFASSIHSLLKEEAEPGVPRLQILQAGAGAGAGLGCPYLIKSLPAQRFDPKKPMAMAPHKHDHPVVALAYFAMSYAGEINTAQQKILRTPTWLKRPVDSAKRILGSNQVRNKSR